MRTETTSRSAISAFGQALAEQGEDLDLTVGESGGVGAGGELRAAGDLADAEFAKPLMGEPRSGAGAEGVKAESFGRLHHLPKERLAAVMDGLRERGRACHDDRVSRG